MSRSGSPGLEVEDYGVKDWWSRTRKSKNWRSRSGGPGLAVSY